MLKNIYLKIALGLVTLVLLFFFITIVLIEPWIGRKIEAKLNEEFKDYQIGIGTVHVSLLKSGVTLENLTITSGKEQKSAGDLTGEITSISVNGIRFINMLLKKKIEISEVTIFDSRFTGRSPVTGTPGPPKISTLNLQINHLFFNKINLSLRDHLSSKSYFVNDGFLNVYDLKVAKQDTLSPSILNHFDFEAEELRTVSSDSMYTFIASRIQSSEITKTFAADSLKVHPNYIGYDFTARSEFVSDRIEAVLSPILVHNFSASAFIKSKSLVSTLIEIGNLDLKVFRDNRRKSRHLKKPVFQEMIYSFPGAINIDSIALSKGTINYTSHARQANEPGRISFTGVNAKLYHISNDTIYKKEKAYLKLNAHAYLMGKGKLSVHLKAGIFDIRNTFSIIGTLSEMDARELNPILEKNSFISVKSGIIDAMSFSFTANNDRATGVMTLRYHDLDVAVINKRTDKTSAIKERLSSFAANIKILDSNPLPGEKVRTGIIAYDRDPEKFLFNYSFKSILSGIKSSLVLKTKK
jgi:hypothetical protein